MPQLNPAPWFMIMVASWATLLILFNSKITSALSQNLPAAYSQTAHKAMPWNWPWA